MPIIEERITSVESTIDAILELNRHVVQSLANHQTQISELRKQTAAMEKRAEAMEKNLESVNRFNRQTRRLLVLIARKADWLDEGDIDQWESEDD